MKLGWLGGRIRLERAFYAFEAHGQLHLPYLQLFFEQGGSLSVGGGGEEFAQPRHLLKGFHFRRSHLRALQESEARAQGSWRGKISFQVERLATARELTLGASVQRLPDAAFCGQGEWRIHRQLRDGTHFGIRHRQIHT